MELLTTIFSTYFLVLVAEFGDKSQLVCLVLAARYGAKPVFLGAILAFTLLTALAVLLGSYLGAWIPETVLHFVLATLFLAYGVQMLRHPRGEAEETTVQAISQYVILKTFALISLSEMGDKTQLLVAGLSAVEPALYIFTGAILALATTSILGAWAGSRILKPQGLAWVHLTGAILFIIFAVAAAYQGVKAL